MFSTFFNLFTCFWHMEDNVRLRNLYSSIFYNNFHPQNTFMWYLLQFLRSFMYLVLHQHVLLFTPCCHTPSVGLDLKCFKAMCDQSYHHVTFNAKAIWVCILVTQCVEIQRRLIKLCLIARHKRNDHAHALVVRYMFRSNGARSRSV